MCELILNVSSPKWRFLGLKEGNGSWRAGSRSTLAPALVRSVRDFLKMASGSGKGGKI